MGAHYIENQMTKKISSSLILILLSTVILIVIVIGINIHLSDKEKMVEQHLAHQRQDANILARAISDNFKKEEGNLQMLSTMIANNLSRPRDVRKIIQLYFTEGEKSYYRGMILLTRDRTVAFATDKRYYDADFSFLPRVVTGENATGLKKAYYVSELVEPDTTTPGENHWQLKFYIAKPIFERTGLVVDTTKMFAGFILLSLDVEYFLDGLRGVLTDSGAHKTWIIDTDGTVLLHSNNHQMTLRSLLHQERGCTTCHSSFNHVDQILRDQAGNITYSDMNGEQHVASFTNVKVGEKKWIVVVGTSYNTITEFSDQNLLKTIVMLIAVILCLGAGAFVLQRRTRQVLAAKAEANYWQEKHALEEAVRISKERYQAIVEQSLAGIYIVQDGKYRFVNRRFCELLGYTPEDVINKFGPVDVTYPEDLSLIEEHLHQTLTNGRSQKEYELRKLRKDGTILPVRLIGNSFTYEGRAAIIGMILDVQKEKSLERQLVQAQKMEVLGQLAGGIAHDFNNVLAIVSVALSGVSRGITNKVHQHYFELASSAIKRGSEVAKRLLTFARMDSVQLVPISLSHIIDQVIEVLKHTVRKDINIRKHVDVDNGMIIANEPLFEQMLLNLCINACDAMMQGGTLTIRLENISGKQLSKMFADAHDEQYITVKIIDTGVGMDKETMEHIFEPFFTTKELGKGTGLGLSIVHSIVRSHNGITDVQSEPGKGTTFTLYFPTVRSFVEKNNQSVERAPSTGSETILIVEDEEALRLILKDALVELGYTVIEAADGGEGFFQYNAKKDVIDLVLMDLGLPRIPGDQLVEALKKLNPQVLIIISTGYLEPMIKQSLIEKGVQAFVPKPYNLEDLASTVRNVLDQNAREDLLRQNDPASPSVPTG